MALVLLLSVCPVLAAGEDDFVRGVWVSSVANLDYPSKQGLSQSELKKEADDIINTCLKTGMNTIFFQVRPCSDALYNSKIFPVSIFLAGESTYDTLSFDPLAYLIDQAHQNGIKLHAWINPYRVTRLGEKEYMSFDEKSPQRQHPEYLLKTEDGNYFFNPALPQVRDLITDGIVEIIENYDVDGIHFDDYFYPEGSFDDSEQFNASGSSDLAKWRTENVNALVKQVHDTIEDTAPEVEFGISPRGVWANDYENSRGSATRGGGSLNSIYCDSLRFIDEGWVDYICPQIYWNIGFEAADYSVLVPWWVNAVKDSGVKLYIGMGDYRTEDAEPDSPWNGTAELNRQLNLNQSYGAISGEVHFRYGVIAGSGDILKLYQNRYDPSPASAPVPTVELLKAKILKLLKQLLS